MNGAANGRLSGLKLRAKGLWGDWFVMLCTEAQNRMGSRTAARSRGQRDLLLNRCRI